MKACKDCKFLQCTSTVDYHSFDKVPEGYLVCRPPATEMDVVYGTPKVLQYAPRAARGASDLCGVDAAWFEAR